MLSIIIINYDKYITKLYAYEHKIVHKICYKMLKN